MDLKVNVNPIEGKLQTLTVEPINCNELTIRTGAALPLEERRQISIGGTNINAPYKFFKNYKHLGDPTKHLVLVHYETRIISFQQDPTDSKAAYVGGELVLEDRLAFLGLNTGRQVGLNEFKKIIRQARPYFSNHQTEYDVLMNKITSFTFTKNAKGADKNDGRGNMTKSIEVTTKTDLPFEFMLFYPLFKHEPAILIKVEIYYNVSDMGGVLFELESHELSRLTLEKTREVLDRECALFEADGITVIWR